MELLLIPVISTDNVQQNIRFQHFQNCAKTTDIIQLRNL